MPESSGLLDFDTPADPEQLPLNFGAYRSPAGRFTSTGPGMPTQVRPFLEQNAPPVQLDENYNPIGGSPLQLQDTLGFTDQESSNWGGNLTDEFRPDDIHDELPPEEPPQEPIPSTSRTSRGKKVIRDSQGNIVGLEDIYDEPQAPPVAEIPPVPPPPPEQRISARVQQIMQEQGVDVASARQIAAL
jgi:hypothetical protein